MKNLRTFEEYSDHDPYGEEIDENDILKNDQSKLKFKVGDEVYFDDFGAPNLSGVYTVKKAYISQFDEHLYDIEDDDGNYASDIFENELLRIGATL